MRFLAPFVSVLILSFSSALAEVSHDIDMMVSEAAYRACLERTTEKAAKWNNSGWSLDTAFDYAVSECNNVKLGQYSQLQVEAYRSEILNYIDMRLSKQHSTHMIEWDRTSDAISGKMFAVAEIRPIGRRSDGLLIQCAPPDGGGPSEFHVIFTAGERYIRGAAPPHKVDAELRVGWFTPTHIKTTSENSGGILSYFLEDEESSRSDIGHLAASILESKRIRIRVDGNFSEMIISNPGIPEGISKTCNFPGE